jgi:hypothetical protein
LSAWFIRYLWASGRNSAIPVVQMGPRVVAQGFYPAKLDPLLRSAGYTPVEVTLAGVEGESSGR